MITAATKKHHTLCWTCQWAAGKDKKCPWACKFQPVPGWKAIPTELKATIGSAFDKIDSFDVYECPQYELMDEMKRRVVENENLKAKLECKQKENKIIINAMFKKKYKKQRRGAER